MGPTPHLGLLVGDVRLGQQGRETLWKNRTRVVNEYRPIVAYGALSRSSECSGLLPFSLEDSLLMLLDIHAYILHVLFFD